MDIIKRNFFRLLRSGALNEFEELEPMSNFKWNRLLLMVKAQDVTEIALRGIKNHQFDELVHIPEDLIRALADTPPATQEPEHPRLSNPLFNRRLAKIQKNERHEIDASMDTLALLNFIVYNMSCMLNKGISLKGILDMGRFLRLQGDKVDFVKLENWLNTLHLRSFAQLEGSILISVFNFEQDEIPFVSRIDKAAYRLTMRSVNHLAIDTAQEWHFRQLRSGFVSNNSSVLRKNLRRSIRYAAYAPIETTSNFINNFARSLSEIEE